MTEKKPMIHGKPYTYVGLKCRCDECRNAQRLYMAEYRLTERARLHERNLQLDKTGFASR